MVRASLALALVAVAAMNAAGGTGQVNGPVRRSTCPPPGDVVPDPSDRPAMLKANYGLHPDLRHVLLPSRTLGVRVEMRVDENGRVTGVCLHGTFPETLEEPLVAAAAALRFDPAVDDDGPVATLVTMSYTLEGQTNLRSTGPLGAIARSDDIEFLEHVAASSDFAEEVQRTGRFGLAKALRVAAYARLGEIATAESLAAAERVERTVAAQPLLPATVSAGAWPTVGWHMSDARIDPTTAAVVLNDTTFAVVRATLLGGFDFFLMSSVAPENPASWTRPKVIAPADRRQATISLTVIEHDTLAIVSGDQRIEFVVSDVERDSDGDGWTDLEEARLGTDLHDADSDHDRIPDGADVCPMYPKSSSEADDESGEILQKAIFAAFALTGSRELLSVTPGTPRVHVDGYAGPILFDRAIPGIEGATGAPYVSWKIVRRTPTEATVELTDWEGGLAAGGQDVFLRKITNRWTVVAQRTTWIS
jgi:hypothetical protein